MNSKELKKLRDQGTFRRKVEIDSVMPEGIRISVTYTPKPFARNPSLKTYYSSSGFSGEIYKVTSQPFGIVKDAMEWVDQLNREIEQIWLAEHTLGHLFELLETEDEVHFHEEA